MARAAPDPILSCPSLAANSGGTLYMEYVKRNCSVHKRVQIRKHFKNTEVWVKLYYIEAQVKLQKKKKNGYRLASFPSSTFSQLQYHNSSEVWKLHSRKMQVIIRTLKCFPVLAADFKDWIPEPPFSLQSNEDMLSVFWLAAVTSLTGSLHEYSDDLHGNQPPSHSS